MSQITEYFQQSELALAAYANLITGVPDKAALIDAGMSDTQAASFTATYSVAAQYNDPNGLSATVFADATGNTYLAIRGTDSAIDMITNVIGIALLGTTALQPQYASLKVKVQEWLGSGVLSPSFTVTGHSLGGFLATGIAADFASNVSHAYLYNSPGVGGITSIVTSPILNALGVTSSFDPDKFSNLKADAGISPIAGLGYQVSPPISIAIEDQTAADVSNPPAARNHSQQVLTDALALYPVFSQLASNLTIEQIGAIVKAANSLSSPTLESALDGLRTILFGPGTTQTATGDRNTF